jgi:hypothetical protein
MVIKTFVIHLLQLNKLKSLLLPLITALTLPTTVNAGIDPEVHRICLKALDYAGCVKVQTEDLAAPTRIIIQEGAATVEGNSCPDSHAYVGNGYCQRVYCEMRGARLFARGHDRRLGGKGWGCKPRWDFAGGSLKFSTNNSAVRTSYNNRCPSEEPEIGRNNSCQNGLSEMEIKAASKPPIGMGEKWQPNR